MGAAQGRLQHTLLRLRFNARERATTQLAISLGAVPREGGACEDRVTANRRRRWRSGHRRAGWRVWASRVHDVRPLIRREALEHDDVALIRFQPVRKHGLQPAVAAVVAADELMAHVRVVDAKVGVKGTSAR